MIQAEIRSTSLAEHGLLAFYAAQSGVEHAKSKCKNNTWQDGKNILSTLPGNNKRSYLFDTATNGGYIRAHGYSRLASGNLGGKIFLLAEYSGLSGSGSGYTVQWYQHHH